VIARGRLACCAAVAVAALTVTPGAPAHGGTRANGYVSSFSALEPNVLGVFVNVFGPSNQMRLSNYSGKRIVVLGSQHEPYLRFTGKTVAENAASPTAYLNTVRRVPAFAVAGATPRWRTIARSASYTWHDHRIVWTAPKPPPAVQESPDEPHLIFNWRIPARADGRPFRIAGFLGWNPPPATDGGGTSTWLLMVAAVVGGALLLAGAVGAGVPRPTRGAPQATRFG
jgi:hypothetical protein